MQNSRLFIQKKIISSEGVATQGALEPTLTPKNFPDDPTAPFQDRLEAMIKRLFLQFGASLVLDGFKLPGLTENENRLLAMFRAMTPNRDTILHSDIPTQHDPKQPLRSLRSINTYLDHIASGVENDFSNWLLGQIMAKFHANSHTEISGTGHIYTQVLDAARGLLKKFAHVDPSSYTVISTGDGSTSAMATAIKILDKKHPDKTAEHQSACMAEAAKILQSGKPNAAADAQSKLAEAEHLPPRFSACVSGLEHHSNDLQWQAFVGNDNFTRLGGHSLAEVQEFLKSVPKGTIPIVSLSAGSNVTGKQPKDLEAIAKAVHAAGGYFFLDYAGAGPYVPTQGTFKNGEYVDGVFYSGHKFMGGPGSPGVLIIHNRLAPKDAPTPGGGTVDLVTPTTTIYNKDPQNRLVAGTPNAPGLLKLAVATVFTDLLGMKTIHDIEARTNTFFANFFSAHSRFSPVGEQGSDTLPVHTVNIEHPTRGTYLHHNFVAQVANDHFGVQVRSGCFCAGPYGSQLYGLTPEKEDALTSEVQTGHEVMKPGGVRASAHYTSSPVDLNYERYVWNAISLFGPLLLNDYALDANSGKFTHITDAEKQSPAVEDGFFHEVERVASKHFETSDSKSKDMSTRERDRVVSMMIQKRRFEHTVAKKLVRSLMHQSGVSSSQDEQAVLTKLVRRHVHILTQHNNSGDTAQFKQDVATLFLKWANKLEGGQPKEIPQSDCLRYMDIAMDETIDRPSHRVDLSKHLKSDLIFFEGPRDLSLDGAHHYGQS